MLGWLDVVISNKSKWFYYAKFPLVPMGVLTPRYAHARPSAQPPIDTSRNFSRIGLRQVQESTATQRKAHA